MEFIKALVETEESTFLKNRDRINNKMLFRSFKRFRKGEHFLSIQASFCHYCTPRTTLNDLSLYKTMEFALLWQDRFIRVQDAFPDFPRLVEIEEYYETVYSYVPVDLIDDLFHYFITKAPI